MSDVDSLYSRSQHSNRIAESLLSSLQWTSLAEWHYYCSHGSLAFPWRSSETAYMRL